MPGQQRTSISNSGHGKRLTDSGHRGL
jgi:hypothetical protein